MIIFNRIIYETIRSLYIFKKLNKICLSDFEIKIYNNYCICYRKSHTIPQKGPWKVLFFGTDEFAVESLKILHHKYETKILQQLEVVTSSTVKENAVMEYANKNKITVNKWPIKINVSDFHIGIVVSFGHLIPSSVINSFPLGMLNIHGSLLPKWRGAAPLIYTLMNGELQTGVTIMKILPKKFDIGPIVLQEQLNINEHETLPELYTKLAKLGAKLLAQTLENLPELIESAKAQDETNVTYAPKVTSSISIVTWNEMSAKNVYDLYRALFGLYPLTTLFQGRKIKLLEVQKIEPGAITKSAVINLNGEIPGAAVYDKKNNALIIKCKGESFIAVKKLIVEGRSRMEALDFQNGFISGKNKTKVFFS